MNLYVRLFIILFMCKWRKPLKALGTSTVILHVLPNDLDLNWHMNNGRFLTIMDLGRMDLLQRSGILKMAVKNKWMPIVGNAEIEFQRPLKLWQKYELHSRVSGWDEKWIYLEQTFYSKEKVIAIGKIKGLLRGKDGNIEPQKYMDLIQPGVINPEIKTISGQIKK